MNFMDMGILEILLILVVALVIWGPDKIPEIGRMLGKFMSTMKRTSFDLTTQIRKELEEEKQAPRTQPKAGNDDTTATPSDTDTAETNDTEKSSPEDQ